MASFVAKAQANSASAFVTAVNTVLAALTNPTIRNFAPWVLNPLRLVGVQYSTLISYTDGGASLATPFLLNVLEASSLATLQTNVQAFITANPSYFFAGTKYQALYNEGNKQEKFVALTIYNTTAGAFANYVPR